MSKEDIKADIRNKLSPFWSLSSMISNYKSGRIDMFDFLNLLKSAAKQCENNKEKILLKLKKKFEK